MKALAILLALLSPGLLQAAHAGKGKKSAEGKRGKERPGSSKGFGMYDFVEAMMFPLAPSKSSFRYDRPKAPYLKQLSGSQRGAIDRLLAQRTRPTTEELRATLKAAYGGMPKSNPFGSGSRIRDRGQEVANLIAQLELAYPGGTYLPLGRDAVLIADLLDAYYRSIGQTDRVRRLDASGTSFPHYRDATDKTFEADRPIITGFLKSNGLDFEKVAADRPYVMVDVTSYGRTSQSTQLMRSAYRTWAELGRDPKDLFDKVNFVGLPQTFARHEIADSNAATIDKVKAKLKAKTGRDGPEDILYVGGSTSGLTYTSAWHGMFDRFVSDGKGGVKTEPGGASSDRERLDVLEELYDAVDLVSSPAFHAMVKKVAAKDYGYHFPTARTSTLKRTPTQPDKRPAPAPYVVPRSFSPPKDFASSAFVRAAKEELTRDPTKARSFLEDLGGMWGRRSVTRGDVVIALREIGRKVDLDGPILKVKLDELTRRYPGFKELLDKGKKAAKAPPTRDVEIDVASYYDW